MMRGSKRPRDVRKARQAAASARASIGGTSTTWYVPALRLRRLRGLSAAKRVRSRSARTKTPRTISHPASTASGHGPGRVRRNGDPMARASRTLVFIGQWPEALVVSLISSR